MADACAVSRRSTSPQLARRAGSRALTLAAAVGLAAAAAGIAAAEDRTFDGWGNNLQNPDWGTTGSAFLRACPPAYSNGFNAMSGVDRPNPRAISNAVSAQTASIPDRRDLSDFAWAWGQFVDHDVDLTPEGFTEEADIPVPAGDPLFDPANTGQATIHFPRSEFINPGAPGDPREHPNTITAYIDASNVYGSDDAAADWLRTFQGGRLKVTPSPMGDLLPVNGGDLNAPHMAMQERIGPRTFVAGDPRANEHIVLLSLHTLWVREHNRLADEIALANPGWNDEQIFQRARKIVGALMQHITYNEWAPAFFGEGVIPSYAGYDPTVNAQIVHEFSTAAFRLGHTRVSGLVFRLGPDGDEIAQGHHLVRTGFFRPDVLVNEGGLDPIMRGLAAKRAQDLDPFIVDDLRNFLFGQPGMGGLDLVSLNIQRGRDHGLASYNDVRAVYGLPRVTSFDQISSNPVVQNRLAAAYDNVDQIDPWVGMVSEDALPNAGVGETLAAVCGDQFHRLRTGDRFYYLNDPEITNDPALLAEIESTTLADVIRRNTGATDVADNVFFVDNPCRADLNDDGVIDVADLNIVLGNFNTPGVAGDANSDGYTDVVDLNAILGRFGLPCD
jgi:hypothetical protein